MLFASCLLSLSFSLSFSFSSRFCLRFPVREHRFWWDSYDFSISKYWNCILKFHSVNTHCASWYTRFQLSHIEIISYKDVNRFDIILFRSRVKWFRFMNGFVFHNWRVWSCSMATTKQIKAETCAMLSYKITERHCAILSKLCDYNPLSKNYKKSPKNMEKCYT